MWVLSAVSIVKSRILVCKKWYFALHLDLRGNYEIKMHLSEIASVPASPLCNIFQPVKYGLGYYLHCTVVKRDEWDSSKLVVENVTTMMFLIKREPPSYLFLWLSLCISVHWFNWNYRELEGIKEFLYDLVIKNYNYRR